MSAPSGKCYRWIPEPRPFALTKRSTNRCSVPGSNNNEVAVLEKPPSKPEPPSSSTSESMQVPTRGSGKRQTWTNTPVTCVQNVWQSQRSDNDKESCRSARSEEHTSELQSRGHL